MSDNQENIEDEIVEDKIKEELEKENKEQKTENKSEHKNGHHNHSEKENKDHKEKKDELFEKLKHEDKDELIKKLIKIHHENEKHKQSLREKENEAQENFDKYRRSLAEFENLRKRTVLEKQDALKYANFNIIADLLVLLDDFQRAIDSTKKEEKTELNTFVEGIEMIEKQFIDLLFKKYGVIKYCEQGEEFDPNIHSAMMAVEGDYDKEEIVEIFRKGYKLHDRVIRAAEVKIGKPKKK
jgi:molecular chaperone GrpE